MIPAGQIRIQPGREHFRQHSRRVAAAMHPPHETRVHVAGGIRQDLFQKLLVDRAQFSPRNRKPIAKTGAHRLRHRLPYGTFADLLQIVEHIVQHAMALIAKQRPILRVQRTIAIARRMVHGLLLVAL